MLKRTIRLLSGVLFVSMLVSGTAQARLAEVPDCEGNSGKALPIDNARVVGFKFSTPNQYLERARVEGRVVRILGSRPSHEHFEIQIGPRSQDTLEVVFNRSFGNPSVKLGDEVEACGDYITSNAPTARYKPSPSGAIIHWVHENSRGGSHPDGYVVVNDRFMHGFGRHPIEVDGSDAEPLPPAADTGRVEAPAKPSEDRRRWEREKENRPRHGRNWRDWEDEVKS